MCKIDVSIILVNYNTKQMTSECINSIRMQTKCCNYEIILVDNASTDGSKDLFEKEKINYIYSSVNLGFGKANNIGIRQARGEYIFLLNTDTILKNDALSYFIDFEKKNGNNKVLGAYLLDGELKPAQSFGEFPSIKSELKIALAVYLSRIPFNSREYYKVVEPKNVVISVDYIVGADLFIPKFILDQCGLFDDKYFMYYEETDLEKRISLDGFERLIIPGPQIVHLCNGSQKTQSKNNKNIKKSIMAAKSMLLYLKKTNNLIKFRLFKITYLTIRLIPIILSSHSVKDKINYLRLFI